MLLYNLFIFLYSIAVPIAGLFSAKAREWVKGRENLFQELAAQVKEGDKVIWIHAASAGELEQGKPVAEALKKEYPDHKLVISFFSPSGMQAGRKYKTADVLTYLPLDTRGNAKRFVEILKPRLVVFIKYDYWYHHLKAVADAGVPLLMVSAIFREKQAFFKWYGGLNRKMLHFFTWFFVQDEDSVTKLNGLGIKNCSAAGDTRFDRVAFISQNPSPIPLVENFVGSSRCIVAGSTWAEDEEMLQALETSTSFKMIVAPHEVSEQNTERLLKLFGERAMTYSDLEKDQSRGSDKQVLVINNIGMLSRLYRHATITYIGGGFNKSGIHNTLEAAAWGKPVLFGPNYGKFREARGLIENGAGWSVKTAEELLVVVERLVSDERLLVKSGASAKNYVLKNQGATEQVMQEVRKYLV